MCLFLSCTKEPRTGHQSWIHWIYWVGRKPKGPLSPASGSTQTTKKSDQMPERVVQIFLEFRQAWCCDHNPGECVPVPDCPPSEQIFSLYPTNSWAGLHLDFLLIQILKTLPDIHLIISWVCFNLILRVRIYMICKEPCFIHYCPRCFFFFFLLFRDQKEPNI